MDGTPLQHHRRARNWTQADVADQLCNVVGPAHGYPTLGVDANAVSRHERGVIVRPRDPYPRAVRGPLRHDGGSTLAAG